MYKKIHIHTFSGASLLSLGLVTEAQAAEPSARGSAGTEMAADYSYRFKDDPLAATGTVSRGMRINVRPATKRVLLIRPRAHFVSELFKSAEDL